jgi:hypothetical protein
MSFLLRFQEVCLEATSTDVPAGTRTLTAIEAEATDSDVNVPSYLALSISGSTDYAECATPTNTAVETESNTLSHFNVSGGSDQLASAVHNGTSTMTFIEAEQSDSDAANSFPGAIPRCSLY